MVKMTKLDNFQRVAALTAMEKAIKSELKASRELVDDIMLKQYEEQGITKRQLTLGRKVGDISIIQPKDEYLITDHSEFDEFALLNGIAEEKITVKPEYKLQIQKILEEHLPEALQVEVEPVKDWQQFITWDGEKSYIAGTDCEVPGITHIEKRPQVRITGCKPEDVAPMLRGVTINQLLLGE